MPEYLFCQAAAACWERYASLNDDQAEYESQDDEGAEAIVVFHPLIQDGIASIDQEIEKLVGQQPEEERDSWRNFFWAALAQLYMAKAQYHGSLFILGDETLQWLVSWA